MLKRLISVLFCVLLFLSLVFKVNAATTNLALTPKERAETEIIVTYRPGKSPKQIETQIAAKEKQTSTLPGCVSNWFSELMGKTPGITYYTSQLAQIQAAEKKAGVKSQSTIIESNNGSVTNVITLEKGKSVKDAVKIFQSLPEVEAAIPNSVRTIQKIQSDEISPEERAKTEILVQYKEGQTPEDIVDTIDDRQKAASLPFGVVRIASIDSSIPNPEQLYRDNADVRTETGTVVVDELLPDGSKKPTPLENTQIVTIDDPKKQEEALEQYKSLPNVAYVTKNSVRKVVDTPNDTFFSKQWNMEKIQGPTAWNTAKGSSNVIVADVDSGVDYNHPDLTGHVVKGANYIQGNSDPMDDNGHGTHVAGIIGALTNNNTGVAGVNWNIKILAIKVMSANGEGNDSSIMQGIHYAADNNAKVINLSLGGPGACDPIFQQTMDYAKSKGALVVVAAGNGDEAGNPLNAGQFVPANCSGVMAVGATGPNDQRAHYSNYGSTVSIAAPGGDDSRRTKEDLILSTVPTGLTYDPNHLVLLTTGYAYAQGTSQAAPHVAGAAGLLLSIKPSMTPDQVKSTLIQNADPLGTDLPIGPRLNLAKAVAAISAGVTITPSPSTSPTATPSGTVTPTVAVTPSTTPSPSTTVTPVPTGASSVQISIRLPGISAAENPNPRNPKRVAEVSFIKEGGVVENKKDITLTYNNANGTYVGTVGTGDLPPGTYQVAVRLENTLNKLVPGFFTISSNSNLNAPIATLSPGDLNLDNILDILDYNILVNCLILQCNSQENLNPADLNDDGLVDAKDLNIFLRMLQQRFGD